MLKVNYILIVLACFLFGASVQAATSMPAVSHDGLHLVQDTKLAAVYLRPGVDLKSFDKIALLEAHVAFRKNWQRGINNASATVNRVSDKDMQNIRDEVAKEFYRMFKKVLSEEGGHQMVDKGAEGVLIIRPAVVDLDVAAPDTMAAGMTRTFSATAGQMTLYMELYDGKTGQIIARVMDPAVLDSSFVQFRNRVTNRSDADRVIRRWAEALNKHLADLRA